MFVLALKALVSRQPTSAAKRASVPKPTRTQPFIQLIVFAKDYRRRNDTDSIAIRIFWSRTVALSQTKDTRAAGSETCRVLLSSEAWARA